MNYEKTILQPLCDATERTLCPIDVKENDYLLIDTDQEGKRFLVETIHLVDDEQDRSIQVNGSVRYIDRYGPRNGRLASEWIHRIPERSQQISYGKYHIAMTDYSVLVIHHVWPADHIIFQSELAQKMYMYLLLRFFAQNKRAEMVARFKLNGEVPILPTEFVSHPELPLADYQKVGLASSLLQESAGLFWDPGVGKTAVCIARTCLEASLKKAGKIPGVKPGIYRVLVMCPKHIRINWENEYQRFATTKGKTVVVRGNDIERLKCIIEGVRLEEDCDWSVCIISVDSVSRTWLGIQAVPWDLAILDESHCIQNEQSKRFNHIKLLNTKARQRMILTGTPITNNVFSLWPQFEFLAEGLSGFSRYNAFRTFHGQYEARETKGGSAIQKLVGIRGIPLIQERLARVAIMMTKKEANLGLPDKVYDLEEVCMTPIQTDVYRTLAQQMVLEISSLLEDEVDNVTINHILTKLLRLAQVTSGHIRTDDRISEVTNEVLHKGHVRQIDITNPKVEAVVRMIREREDALGKTVIWCTFVEDIRILSQALHDEGIKHTGYHREIHEDYRVPTPHDAAQKINCDITCTVLIANPQSAGAGLNILGYDPENPGMWDTYVNHVVYFSCNWSSVQRAQSEDRCHRRGTRANVRITDLVVPGTIDEEIRARVNSKKEKALMIQDIQEILKKLL